MVCLEIRHHRVYSSDYTRALERPLYMYILNHVTYMYMYIHHYWDEDWLFISYTGAVLYDKYHLPVKPSKRVSPMSAQHSLIFSLPGSHRTTLDTFYTHLLHHTLNHGYVYRQRFIQRGDPGCQFLPRILPFSYYPVKPHQ